MASCEGTDFQVIDFDRAHTTKTKALVYELPGAIHMPKDIELRRGHLSRKRFDFTAEEVQEE